MALHFKDHTRIPLGDDVFLSVNVINGKGLFNFWKARKIISPIHPNRTITVPGPSGICLSYGQFIELIDKAPLMISIVNSMWKEKGQLPKREEIDHVKWDSRKPIVLDEPVVQRRRRTSRVQSRKRKDENRKSTEEPVVQTPRRQTTTEHDKIQDGCEKTMK